MTVAIKVENLSKKYVIGAAQERQDTLRDWLVAAGRSLRRRPTTENEFWALRDVSFEVQRGEVVGVIGRNGAGKSTLLKILSRITEPTSGRAYINGRVGSLLEVGTGFHPELTGRENIFLNGAILGMRRTEIARKFDEIVAFAEIEKFLDTPVKRYSSGMYVRLAFAVAAHLEPEILLVDEVLAVGDAAFQKKCLGKMGDVAKEGRTVLFVSHNMAAVSQLCKRSVWLEAGCLQDVGTSSEIVRKYLSRGMNRTGELKWNFDIAPGDDEVRLLRARILQRNQLTSIIDINQPFCVEFVFTVLKTVQNLYTGILLYNIEGVCIFDSDDWKPSLLEPGKYTKYVEIPGFLLAEGEYTLALHFHFYEPFKTVILLRDQMGFEAIDSDHPDSVRGLYRGGPWPGIVRVKLNWSAPKCVS